MINKLNKTPYRFYLLFSALLLIAVFLLKGLYLTVAGGIYQKNGSLVRMTLRAEDFTLSSMVEKDGKLVATDSDPQMITDVKGRLSEVTFYMEADLYPGEMAAFYTEKEGEPFSVQKRVWIKPIQGQDNMYSADLGLKYVEQLRIDPTMYGGNRMVFGDFEFSPERPVSDNFAVSYGEVFNLIVYSGFISGLAKLAVELARAFFERKKKR